MGSTLVMAAAGLVSGLLFVLYARRTQEPLLRLDLLKVSTLRAAILPPTFAPPRPRACSPRSIRQKKKPDP